MRILLLVTVLACAGASSSLALVNPALQPFDLTDRHKVVVATRVSSVDAEARQVKMEVVEVLSGEFNPKAVTLSYGEDMDESASFEYIPKGRIFITWAGKRRGRDANAFIMYAGDRQWHEGEVVDWAKGDEWKWTREAEELMVGTFNGHSERLLEMLQDAREQRHFIPAVVYAKFKPDHVIAEFKGSIAGVALYDINDDGRLDALACAPDGVKAFLQQAPGEWKDATADLGLAGVRGSSISIADVNGNRKPDLLIDGVIYINDAGRFSASRLLPDVPADQVHVSTFGDFNGDGHPDVLISRKGGGLTLLLNPGKADAAFTDATEASGLREAEPEGYGYVTVGDWNLDGRLDIFYASGQGLLLEQDAEGRFNPVPHRLGMDFRGGQKFEPGASGAGTFAPVWRPDRMDLIVPMDMGQLLLTNKGGQLTNVTGFGNEIALASTAQSATLAEDLDMDGHVDLLTISRDQGASNSYHVNRGYGTFMHAEVYQSDFWPGESYRRGAGGVAAGDVDGDGANDILIGGLDGRLVLVLSDAMSVRAPSEHPVHHLRILQQTGIVSVQVTGELGVTGALVRLLDSKGEVVALRSTGLTTLTGCHGPDATNIAVRHPGSYKLVVRYSDGHEVSQAIEVKPASHLVIKLNR